MRSGVWLAWRSLVRSDVPSTRHETVSCAEAISLALVTPRGVSIMHLSRQFAWRARIK